MGVLLLSGGIDSALILKEHATELECCLFVDYGQPAAEQEFEHSRALARAMGVPYLRLVRPLYLGAMSGDSTNNPMVVPHRNMNLLAAAANLYPATEIFYGAIQDDSTDYRDCRPDFFGFAAKALNCRIRTPLMHYTKSEVIRRLGRADTFSCYTPAAGKPCGVCNSCKAVEAAAPPRG